MKEADNWLRQAEDDLEKSKDNFEDSHFDGAAFFAQQTAEKALKALLIKKTRAFPKIHDVVALSRMADAPDNIIESCKVIAPYYTETRYPDLSEKIPAEAFSKEEVNEVIQLAGEVLKWAKKSLT
jgi:HEPN domain-containing protein